MKSASPIAQSIEPGEIHELIGEAQTLLGMQMSPLLRKEVERFIDTAVARSRCLADLKESWCQIKSHWQSTFSTTSLFDDYIRRTHRLIMTLIFILSIEHTGEATEKMIDQLATDKYVSMCGSPNQRRIAAQLCTNGDEGELATMFEENVLRPAEELLLDAAYVKRRYQMAAARTRLIDMISSQSEKRDLIAQDYRTISIVSDFDNEYRETVKPLVKILDRQSPLASLLPSISQLSNSSESPGIVRRVVRRRSSSALFPDRQSFSTSIDLKLGKVDLVWLPPDRDRHADT